MALIYVAGPEIYRRGTAPVALTGATRVTPTGSGQISTPLEPLDASRVYTNKTVQNLAALYEGRTAMQADVFMADEKGKWINTEGILQRLTPTGTAAFMNGGNLIVCSFNAKWKTKLGALRISESIKIAGKISENQVGSWLDLSECELRD